MERNVKRKTIPIPPDVQGLSLNDKTLELLRIYKKHSRLKP